MAQSSSENVSFVCFSGELLWGQLHCIAEGYLANSAVSQSTPPSPLKGGTIIQHNLQYRVNAARGEWKVKDIVLRSQPEGPSSHAGFVIYNKEIADPVAILQDCAKLGMRSCKDKGITYVNRYDWSFAHEMPRASQELLYDQHVDDEHFDGDLERKFSHMMGKRIILADAGGGLSVINQLKQSLSAIPRNALIKDTVIVENDAVGVHLAMPDTEYELGWMVFNPSKTEELIAFVYDGAYCGLEGDISLRD